MVLKTPCEVPGVPPLLSTSVSFEVTLVTDVPLKLPLVRKVLSNSISEILETE